MLDLVGTQIARFFTHRFISFLAENFRFLDFIKSQIITKACFL